jgi:hypothetical protein
MDITRLVYIGPAGSKTASGIEFKAGVPMDVEPRRAKSILKYWPGQFAAVLPCENCQKRENSEIETKRTKRTHKEGVA